MLFNNVVYIYALRHLYLCNCALTNICIKQRCCIYENDSCRCYAPQCNDTDVYGHVAWTGHTRWPKMQNKGELSTFCSISDIELQQKLLQADGHYRTFDVRLISYKMECFISTVSYTAYKNYNVCLYV